MSESATATEMSDLSTTNAAANKTKSKRKRNRRRKKKGGAAAAASGDSINIIDDDESLYEGGFLIGTNNNNGKENNQKKKNNRAGKNSNNSKSIISNNKSNKILTPQEMLRDRLIERDGYEVDRIDQAMGEMWDKGLPYDEYEAVLNYLQNPIPTANTTIADDDVDGGGGGGGASFVDVESHNRNKNKIAIAAEDMDSAASSSSPQSAAATTATAGFVVGGTSTCNDMDYNGKSLDANGGCDVTVYENDEGNNNDNETEDEDESKKDEEIHNRSSPSQHIQTKAPTTMAEKLDMVAGFENLTDAIFALTQWVNKAAKYEDIEDLCRARKTSALPTVVRRGISTEITDQKKFETAVQPGLVGLLVSVLGRCGVEYDDVERIENLLKQAWKVSLMHKDNNKSEDGDNGKDGNDDDIAHRVAKFIVSRIAIAMDESKDSKFVTDTFGAGGRTVIDGDDNDNDEALMTLTRQRDTSRKNAERACTTVRLTMEQLLKIKNDDPCTEDNSNGSSPSLLNGNGGVTSSSSMAFDNQNTLLLIVDQETKDRFNKEKSQLEELKSLIRDGESDEVRDLRATLDTLENERLDVQGKISDLTLTLKKLEAQNDEIGCKIETLEQDIENRQRNDNKQTQQLEKQIQDTKDVVKYGNIVSSLASMMKSYGKALEKAAIGDTNKGKSGKQHLQQEYAFSAAGDNNNNNKAPNISDKRDDDSSTKSAADAMKHYLRTVRDYFLTESKLEIQLRQQILSNTNEIAALKRELAQCAGLGMSTTTNQIEKSISLKENLIVSFSRKVSDLIQNATSTYNELIHYLETYESSDAVNNLLLVFPTDLLRDVPAVIKAFKIPNSDRLEQYALEFSSSVSSTTDNNNNSNNNICNGLSSQHHPLGGDSLPSSSTYNVSSSSSAAAVATTQQSAVVAASTTATTVAPPSSTFMKQSAAAAAVPTAVKFTGTWCLPSVAPPPKQSLLDIQNQELNSKENA